MGFEKKVNSLTEVFGWMCLVPLFSLLGEFARKADGESAGIAAGIGHRVILHCLIC